MNIIPATLVREQANKALRKNTNGTLSKIMEQVQKDSMKGEFTIFFYETIPNNVQDILTQEGNGYKIDNLSDQRDGICYKISW